MDTDATEVLADLERLALAGLRHETERLEAALRAEHKREREEGPKGAAVISPVSAAGSPRAGGSCLDALELWERAHDARAQVEEEARAQSPEEEAGGAD